MLLETVASDVFTSRHQPLAAAPSVQAGYRPDIDGLRAVAVVAVVLTHAGVAGFGGGYIGVDIFFVISGFLITRNLENASRSGKLNFLSFYGRRVRRTLPALYFVAATTLGAGAVLLLPSEFDELAQSLIAAALFVPNILFLTQAGYFDHAAISKPFLHSWSLGVEEQFYLLAPLLPLALRRMGQGRAKAALLLGLFGLSIAFCIGLRGLAPDAAFYLMPARLWEFLLGCIVAESIVPPLRLRWLSEAAAVAALAGLAVAIAFFSTATAHPGLATLLPCLSTATLIHLGMTRTTVAAQLLGSLPLRGVGLISYSIYLWHWPLLAFARVAGLPLTPTVLMAGGAVLLVLSAASWRWIELPFRQNGSPVRRHAGFILAMSATFLVAASLAVILERGIAGRFPPVVASVASFYDYRSHRPYREGQCFITSKNSLADYDRAACLQIDPARRNVLLLGDSQAAHWWTGLRDRWPQTNFLQATASGCKPVLGTTGASRCTRMMGEMLREFLPAHRLDGVVLSALWEPEDIEPLQATIAYLKPLTGKVTVFGPLLRYDEPAATLIAKSLLRGNLAGIKTRERPDVPLLDARMREEIGPLAAYVSTYDAICPHGACRRFAAPGIPMQFDYHHLTKEGAAVLTRRLGIESP